MIQHARSGRCNLIQHARSGPCNPKEASAPPTGSHLDSAAHDGSSRSTSITRTLALGVCLLLLLSTPSLLRFGASIRPPPRSQNYEDQTEQNILRRIPFPNEHVVLADCKDSRNYISSQMAYFRNSPGPNPVDVAVVKTNPGEAALWVNSNTSGLFTTSGVTFTATIGPKVEEGQFAGTGDNTYQPGFSCYQQFQANLYVYGGTTCKQVYFCNHSDPPAIKPGSASASPSASPSALSSGATSSKSGNEGLPQGTLIAIVVGVVGAVMFCAAIGALIWFCRRSRKRQQSSELRESLEESQHDFAQHTGTDGQAASAYTPEPPSSPAYTHPPESRSTQASDPLKVPPGMVEMPTVKTVFEVDGQWYRYEMPSSNDRYEMDGQGRVELDSTSRSTLRGDGISPASPPIPSPCPDSTVWKQKA